MEYIQAKFSIGDLLSKLLSSITKIPSFMDGFDVTKTDANMDGSVITCSRVLQSQKYGSLTVTVGVDKFTDNEIIEGCTKALDQLSSAQSADYELDNNSNYYLGLLCGTGDRTDNNGSLLTSGELLDPKLTDKTTTLSTIWQKIANNLKYNLRCEAQGYSGGSVSDKSINEILPMVSQYLQRCGAVPQSETAGFNINPVYLVLPILIAIQDYLSKYLDSVNKILSGEVQAEQPESTNQNDQQDQNQTGQSNNSSNTEADQNTNPLDSGTTENTASNTNSSKLVDIKLQKITGSTDIDLMAIKANFNPGEALTAVDDVLSSPDFIELITETPQSYEVLVDDVGYDINPCTDLIVEPNENLTQLFIQAIQFSRNLHMIHWLAIGNDMEKLHIKAEELYDELDEEIDLLAELIVEKTGTIIDINKIETWDTVGTQDRTFQQGIECIKQYAQSFIDYIDITYPNQPSDVQSILDEWLRYWNKQINYFINREQEI